MANFRPRHVRAHTVARLAEQFDCELRGDGTVEFTGITSSSSGVTPGDLFVALPGASTHGARFAASAIDDGAVAVLTDTAGAEQLARGAVPVLITETPREALGPVSSWLYQTASYAEDAHAQLVFGVTGTNGKTSVVYLLAALAEHLGRPVALSSTAERRIASEGTSSGLTTPEANELHALLALAREREVHTAAIEVSAHALSRNRVDGVVFDVVGFTNLSHDHLDDYPDMQSYYDAKRDLFTPGRSRRGVVVVDDDWGRRLVEDSRIPVTTLSLQAGADWLVTITRETAAATSFTLSGHGRALHATVPMLGAFSATNAALAIVMWTEAGWDLERIEEALSDGLINAFVPGRTEAVSGPNGPLVLVDYAHTPDAFRQLLSGLRRVCEGRVIMVFGADGDRDRSKRAEMGANAALGADVVIITDFHPRFEDPEAIRASLIAGAVAAVPDVELYEIADPRAAIRAAIALASDADIVVYAGPGHEEYHQVAGTNIPYSARDDARAALREAGLRND